MTGQATRQPNFAMLLIAGWLLILVQLVMQFWPLTATTLPDADDAMRLVEMRDFLAGQGWFDLHQARLAPPLGYESHWSRLIDAGLAGMVLGFQAFVPAALAERLMLTIWPMLWLIPAIGGAAAIAWRIGGRPAAVAVLLLAVFNMPGFQQFRPGRIDHHNVQIALGLLAVAATAWADRKRWAAPAAGALSGLALAIGLEGVPYLAVCGIAFALHFCLNGAAGAALFRYGLALALSTLAAFLVSVGPQHWTQSVCDTIAINSTAAVVVAGLGMMLASRFATRPPAQRVLAVATAGIAAAAVFAAFEPRCFLGPYALIDPAIVPIYFADLSEMQPLAALMRRSANTGAATLAFPAASLLAIVWLARRRDLRRDGGALLAAAAAIMAFAVMATAIKGYSYAIWFGLPLVAAALPDLFERLRLRSLPLRFLLALLATPTMVTIGAMSVVAAAGYDKPLDIDSPSRQACVRKDSYAALAALPPGLVVANELEWAPYLLAYTPHSVLGGPYHRLSDPIVETHQIFSLPPAQAHDVVRRVHADYVLRCGAKPPTGVTGAALEASLWGRLSAGDVPDWLRPVALAGSSPFKLYRVVR